MTPRKIRFSFSAFAAHPWWTAIGGIIVLACLWWGYKMFFAPAAPTKYVLATVEMGTITSSVTGSGEVVAADQVTINPKASGQITAVYVHDGQYVGAGDALAQIDARTAVQSVKSAEADVQAAQLALAKLQEPADQLSTTQAQDAIAKAQEAQATAQTDLTKTYQDGYNDAVATYLDLPDIMNGLKDILNGTEAARGTQSNVDYYRDAIIRWDNQATSYHDNAIAAYNAALAAYNAALADYQTTSQTSSTSTIGTTIGETYQMAQDVSTALNSANSFITDYETVLKGQNQTPNAFADTSLTNLNAYIGKMNTHISTLLADKNTITSDKQTINDSARTIVEDQQSLTKLQSGADPIDIQTTQLSVQQKENALTQAQQQFDDYTIRAPFAGALGSVNLHRGDTVGSGTAVAVEVSSGYMADLSLNEVDAAKVSVGQKAILTFDAIDGLTIAGHVASISPVGTVSQGVVNYDVKIAFDTQDDRIRSGMTVNAAIITAVKTNTLVIPSGAIKTSNGSSYVLVVDNPPPAATSAANTPASANAGVALAAAPRQVSVATGISSDTQTEILSGLTEGQTIVARTVASQTATTQNAPSLFGGGGVRTGGGGVRTGGGG